MQGDLTRAETLYGEALALHRELGDLPDVAGSVDNLGLLARMRVTWTGRWPGTRRRWPCDGS